jgi:hypothetical protein
MNRRDAINEILISLNELPLSVDDLVADVPTAVIVDTQLEISKKKVLSYGWEFNTLTLSLYPNGANHIVVPSSFLSVNGTSDYTNVIVKDWKLFDKEGNSFKFTTPVDVVVIEDVVFDDIPFHIANYVVQMTALQAYINIIGNTDDVTLRHRSMLEAKTEAIREDSVNINGNIIDPTKARR